MDDIDKTYLEYLTDLAWQDAKTPTPHEAERTTGHSHNTIKKSLGRLVAAGEIEVEEESDRFRYVMVKPDIALGWRRKARRRNQGAGPRRMPKNATMRPCLTCSSVFASEGNHHRICDGCKDTNVFRGSDMGGALCGSRRAGNMMSDFRP